MPEVSSVSDRWLTVEQAAQYLQFSQGYLRKLIHDGRLKVVPFDGHAFRIDRQDVDALMQRLKQTLKPYRKGTRPWVAKRHASSRRKKASR